MRVTYREHCHHLANLHKVELVEDERMHFSEGKAIQLARGRDVKARTVFVTPVTDALTYAVCLHEIGHCAHPQGLLVGKPTDRRKLRCEKAAWKWAKQNAMQWTAEMEAVKTVGLATYAPSFPCSCMKCKAKNKLHPMLPTLCGKCGSELV